MGYRKTGDFRDRVAEEKSCRPKRHGGVWEGEAQKNGRVLASFGHLCIVRLENGEELRMSVNRKMTAITGDFVETDGSRVVNVLPRQKVLARADAMSTQIIATNIDRVVLVQSVSSPPFKQGLTDRYLVFTRIMDLPLLLVLNKIDRAPENLESIMESCREHDIEVLPVSARSGRGMDDLGERLRTGTSVFSGHSGVGKSSLLSYLLPGVKIGIGELNPASGLGRQKTTTTRSYIFRDGCLIDTPGIRQFGFVGVDPCDVARAFPEIAGFASECRFRNCLHDNEPDCAVKRAVEEKKLPADRYLSYHRIVASVKV